MSVTHGSRKTPHIALFTGTAIGLAVIMAVWFALGAEKGGAVIGATLLNMAVFGAMISYAFQGLSFILLRRNMPNIERPYRSPLGIPGAAATVVIALVTLYYQLQDPVYRARRVRGAGVVRARRSVLRVGRPAQAGAVARGRVRDHRRPARPSRARRLRHDQAVTTR